MLWTWDKAFLNIGRRLLLMQPKSTISCEVAECAQAFRCCPVIASLLAAAGEKTMGVCSVADVALPSSLSVDLPVPGISYLQEFRQPQDPSWTVTTYLLSLWTEAGHCVCVYKVATNTLSEFVSQRLVIIDIMTCVMWSWRCIGPRLMQIIRWLLKAVSHAITFTAAEQYLYCHLISKLVEIYRMVTEVAYNTCTCEQRAQSCYLTVKCY